MATTTLTYAATTTSSSSYTKLTIPNAATIPRTKSVESIKLIGRNPSPPPQSSTKLQRSSSASEMLALVNLANLQRLHVCASEPSSSSGGLASSLVSQEAEDEDDEENAASSSDSEECETPDQTSPPFTRPTSPIGYIYDFDSEDDETWDIRKVKYTAGAELAPCFARGAAATTTAESAAAPSSSASSLRSSFSDSEDDEDEEDGMMINSKKRSWSPGTPAIEKVEYHWNTPTTATASSSASSSTVTTPLTPIEDEEDGYFNDDDDDDMVGSELDAGEVWPDEMDSDDFPFLHTWPHSWIWTPPSDSPSTHANPTPNPLPMIHFHYVESQVPDQSSWTPIQDSRFGNLLTVPGHRAYNSVEATATKARLPSRTVVAPVQQMCEGARVEFDDKLGRCAVKVPGLKEQREMGLYSVPSFSTSSSSSSSSQKKGRGRARSRVRGMEDDDEDDDQSHVDDSARGRGRSSARKPTVQSARHFVLSSIREAEDDEEEEEPFVYDGVSGRARGLVRWD